MLNIESIFINSQKLQYEEIGRFIFWKWLLRAADKCFVQIRNSRFLGVVREVLHFAFKSFIFQNQKGIVKDKYLCIVLLNCTFLAYSWATSFGRGCLLNFEKVVFPNK